MAEFATKQNVKVAASRTRVPFNLSHKTITTQDISVLVPISVKEIVPGDSFTCNVNSFVRLAPLPCPTYGDMKLINRGFFVPYRTIMHNWNDFENNTPFTTFSGVTNQALVPTITLNSIYAALTTPANGYMVQVSSGDRFDLEVDSTHRYRFLYQGKRIYQLLISLGYQIFKPSATVSFSLLPLLAYVKVYYDWYLPSPFVESYFYRKIFNNPGNFAITTQSDANDFLSHLPFYEPLEKDYFTSAFLEPFGNPSSQNKFNISSSIFGFTSGFDNCFEVVSTQPVDRLNNQPSTLHSSDNLPLLGLTQYGLDTLKAVDQFVKRNQIAGNRITEQHLARYGVRVSDAVANRSYYLGYKEQRISIGEVMSTADTSTSSEPSNLGDYAGRGVGSSQSSFKLDSDEFGIMIILSCVQVTTGYPYGYKRELVMHKQREDFFTPEYDTLGNQPISKGEVFSSKVVEGSQSYGKADAIFGWTPRYSEYKTSLDNLHGDFLVSEYNEGMDSWHLFRSFGSGLLTLQPDLAFINGDPMNTLNNFDRIFTVNQGQDHFIGVYDVQIKAFRKMKSLSDSLLTDGEGGEVSVGYNGTNL